MATIQTVALAGATGSVGAAVLQALIDANFTVTALTRPSSSYAFPQGVKVVEVDYSDTSSLALALRGQDALISAVGLAAVQGQEALMEAAITAGVKRVIPSEFGGDPDVPAVRRLPVFAPKVQVEQQLKRIIEGTSTTYTLVCNNELFDWDLDNNFGVDIKGKKIEIFDGGDNIFTATPLDFVARGVVSVLQHPAETANRVVRLHGASLTQNKLLAILQRFTGKEGWEIKQASTADREKQAYEALEMDPSNFWAWGVPFLHCAIWREGYGGDLSKNNDNELLGLKELSDAEVEEIVRSRA